MENIYYSDAYLANYIPFPHLASPPLPRERKAIVCFDRGIPVLLSGHLTL